MNSRNSNGSCGIDTNLGSTGSTCTRWAFVLLWVFLGSSVGCRSTSRWSPTSWFANREPDASMIAGRADASSLPTSPALNHNPTALASNFSAGGKASSNSTIAPNSLASQVAGNGTGQGGLAYGNPPAGGAMPESGGLASRANGFQAGGYQTGPYGMSAPTGGSSYSVPTAQAPAIAGISAPDVASNPQGGFPSPYGGSYPMSSTPAPGGMASNAGYSGSPAASIPPSTGGSGFSSASLPDYPSIPVLSVSAKSDQSTNVSAYPSQASASSGGFDAGVLPIPPLNSAGASAPTGVAVGAQQGSNTLPPSAYQSAPSTGGFAPGTTGRSTNYNFGVGGGSNGNQSSSSFGLPPNTATGSSTLLR